MGFMTFTNAFKTRRLSRSSQSSSGSVKSALSAASTLSDQQLDNFRSMRGKAGINSQDVSYNMADDVVDLSDRLVDIQKRKEVEKRVLDSTGHPYSILVTFSDVRLQHVDDKGLYHYNHFGSEKPAKHARRLGQRRDPDLVKQHWAVVDVDGGEAAAPHIFVHITPSLVTVHHLHGTWQCRRIGGFVLQAEDSARHRRMSKRTLRPGGEGGADAGHTRTFRLYGANDDVTTTTAAEPLLCANTPGERGAQHQAHQSYYHDL